jgi:hypothetical protein
MTRTPADGLRRPTAVEAWLEQRIPPYGFGLVLLLLIATYVVMASNPPQQWARIVTVTLEGVTLLAALVAARSRRGLFRVAALVVLFAILGAIASLAVSSAADTTGWFFALNVLLVGAAPVAIGYALYRRVVVDIRTVLGSICIYLLIGFMYAFAYAAIGTIGSQPFFVQVRDPHLSVYLYFSFVTQTTVGYGDYTAAASFGRTLATSEALVGQLYLVTVIAVLVSRMSSGNRTPPDDNDFSGSVR